MNFCPRCGADLSTGTGDHGVYERWLRPALVFVGAATLVVGFLALLLVLLIAAVDLPDSDTGVRYVTFHNATDTTLCFAYPGLECPEIKPRETTRWLLDSCFAGSQHVVTVYTQDGRELYRGLGYCEDWDEGFVVINYREGEFLIADSLNAQPPPAVQP